MDYFTDCITMWAGKKPVQIIFEYINAKEEITKRTVDIYEIKQFKDNYYFSGHCYLREESRDFKISRAKNIKILTEPCPKEFLSFFKDSGIEFDQQKTSSIVAMIEEIKERSGLIYLYTSNPVWDFNSIFIRTLVLALYIDSNPKNINLKKINSFLKKDLTENSSLEFKDELYSLINWVDQYLKEIKKHSNKISEDQKNLIINRCIDIIVYDKRILKKEKDFILELAKNLGISSRYVLIKLNEKIHKGSSLVNLYKKAKVS